MQKWFGPAKSIAYFGEDAADRDLNVARIERDELTDPETLGPVAW
jgi:hypothetical protein